MELFIILRAKKRKKLHVYKHLCRVLTNIAETLVKQILKLLLNAFLQFVKLCILKNDFILIEDEHTSFLILKDATLLFLLNNATFFLDVQLQCFPVSIICV